MINSNNMNSNSSNSNNNTNSSGSLSRNYSGSSSNTNSGSHNNAMLLGGSCNPQQHGTAMGPQNTMGGETFLSSTGANGILSSSDVSVLSSSVLLGGGGPSASSSMSPNKQFQTLHQQQNNAACSSNSSNNNQNQNAVELLSLFECPVCFDYALPPILQCQSGHIVCALCHLKLSQCPTCRGPLNNIRNLAMEKLVITVNFPCKYALNGCGELLGHTKKVEHEDMCEFRPYTCPCPGASCHWMGTLEQVMGHLLAKHKSITTLQGEDIVFLATDINLGGSVDWVMMQSCFGHSFMLVLEKQERNVAMDMNQNGHPLNALGQAQAGGQGGAGNGTNGQQMGTQQMFYAVVQLIGTRKQAENFAYRLELNGRNRRLTWEATPRSIHEPVLTAITNSDCMVFDSSQAQLFAEGGNLGINVTISHSPAHSTTNTPMNEL